MSVQKALDLAAQDGRRHDVAPRPAFADMAERRRGGPDHLHRPPAILTCARLGGHPDRAREMPAPTSSKWASRSPIRSRMGRSSSARANGRSPAARRCAARSKWSRRSAPRRDADRSVHVCQPGRANGADGVRADGARRRRGRRADPRLPVEEAEPLRAPWSDAGLDPIFLIEPDHNRRADPAVRGARSRISLRDLAARRDRRARQFRRRMSEA